MAIKDYSTTPDLNTQISGINIAEGCAPSGINNAIRQLMADVKAESEATQNKDTAQDAAIAGKLDKSGGTMTGALEFAQNSNIAIKARGSDGFGIHREVNNELWDTNFFRLQPDGTIWMRSFDNGDMCDYMFHGDGAIRADGAPINLPTGSVIAFAAASHPEGFLLCNGATVSRTTYASLFSIIGTTYGTGDGSSTFTLPNLVDRFVMGSTGCGTYWSAGVPNVYGDFDAESGSGYANTTGAFVVRGADAGKAYSAGGSHLVYNFNASRSNSIYGNSDTVQPPALTMRYYIKY